jgi:hypothetical protein
MVVAKKIADRDYFSIGGTTRDEFIASASALKDIYDRGLYKYIVEPFEVDDKLQDIFAIGTAFHSFILEPKEFEKNYTFEKDPFSNRKLLDKNTKDFLELSKDKIKLLYPDFLKTYNGEDGLYSLNEMAFVGEIEDIKVKGKLDRVIIDIKKKIATIYDLKSIYKPLAKVKRDSSHKAWELKRTINEFNIDLQMAWYKRLIREYLITTYGDAGMQFDIVCKLLFASKEDNNIQMVRLSEDEVLLKGDEKVDIAFGEVKNYVLNGQIDKEIVI